MRIIDADKLKAHYAWWKGGSRELTMDEAKSDFDTIIDLQPTVELKPIVIDGEEYLTGADYNAYLKGYADGKAEPKHGRWIDNGTCSICGCRPYYATNIKAEYHHCPNCGALMTDEVESDTETLEVWNLDGSPTRYIKGERMDEVEE